jgi:hypothetical protein
MINVNAPDLLHALGLAKSQPMPKLWFLLLEEAPVLWLAESRMIQTSALVVVNSRLANGAA